MMITTDKILKEYFYRRDDGGAFFDMENYDDLHHFETFLLNSGYINDVDKEQLNELFGTAQMSGAIEKGSGFIKSKLSGLWRKISDIVKKGYRLIVSKFKRYVDSIGTTIENHDVDDVFYVVIPSIEEPNLKDFEQANQEVQSAGKEGGLDEITSSETALKGYYNEALTAFYVVKKNKTPVKVKMLSESVISENVETDDEMIVVQLENEKSAEVVNIYDEVTRIDSQLQKASGTEYKTIKSEIEMASRDMADYLINTVGSDGGVILEVYLTGKKEMGISKADIRLKIKKGAKQCFRAWSLKMYQDRKVTLLNTSLRAVIESICGKEFLPKLDQIVKSNVQFNRFKAIRQSAERIKNAHYDSTKKVPQTIDATKVIKRLTKYALPLVQQAGQVMDRRVHPPVLKDATELFNEAIRNIKSHPNDIKAVQTDLRIVRDIIGNGANPYVAEIVAKMLQYCLKSGDSNREIFSRNLLNELGFSDKDTEFLMALVGPRQKKAGKSELVVEHPELDLDNLKVDYKPGQTNFSLINANTLDKIVQFTTKEAGGVTATVKFEE
jgi:hypothetical protein